MNENRRSDDIVRAWVQAGPERASVELIDRTLRPVPLMRQRRSWRVVAGHLGRPASALVGIAAVLAVIVVAGALMLRPGGLGGVAAQPQASSAPTHPTVRFSVDSGPGAGTYVTDPAANLNRCTKSADGSWRLQYVGGTPAINLDMLVGAGAEQPAGSSRVAVEVEYGPGYVRFDPADMRGGDIAGRSTASVAVASAGGSTTFTVHATTPDRSTGEDLAPVVVDITVTCPG